MKAIEFPQVNVRIAENQPEYETLPALVSSEPEGRITTCFQLSDEELKEIALTGKLWHLQLAFHQPMQPIALSTQIPFEKPYSGLRVFELQHPDGEKEWIAAHTIIEALQTYCSTTDASLFELDDYDLVEVPQTRWDELNIVNPDCENDELEKTTLREIVQGMTNPDIIGGTFYD
ncbi:MAG: hypothetical protein CVU09_00315 [Bacteroidetes bacterium HGW-Bacteroidetes-4]|jgi:hypothetical protein|nr:MAG: hypothetical protein CVU09_00315 [Bacteroidetes bacterium HGW-Bacteroidetes-4]